MNEQEERELVKYGDGVVVGINTLLIDLKAAYDKSAGLWQFGYLVEQLLKDYGVDLDDEIETANS